MNTLFHVFLNLLWSDYWLKMPSFWAYFMFMEVRKYLAAKLTAGDFRIQVTGPHANYVYGYHVIPITSGALGYVSYQKGIIQGHPDHRYATRDALGLRSRIMFRAVLSLGVSTQTVFLCYKSIKYSLRVISGCFHVHVTHWLLCQMVENNTIFQPFIGHIFGSTGKC